MRDRIIALVACTRRTLTTQPQHERSALATARQRRLGRLTRWLLAAIPLAWIARQIDLDGVTSALAQVDPVRFAVAAALLGASIGAGTLRWRLLLRAFSSARCPPLSALFAHNLVASYLSLLPGGLIGDAVRGLRVRNALPDLSASFSIVIVERISGLLGLLFVTVVATVGAPDLRDGPLAVPIYAVAAGVGALGSTALALPALLRARPGLRRLVERVPLVGPAVLRLHPMPAELSLLTVHACSVLATGVAVVGIGLAVSPLAPEAPTVALYALIPAALLLTFVPVTPGAIGQREAVWVVLLGSVGVPAHSALAVSFTVLALGLCYPALGALYYFAETLRAPPA